MSPDKAMIGYLQARIAELEAEVERLRAENHAMWEALGRPLSVEPAAIPYCRSCGEAVPNGKPPLSLCPGCESVAAARKEREDG